MKNWKVMVVLVMLAFGWRVVEMADVDVMVAVDWLRANGIRC